MHGIIRPVGETEVHSPSSRFAKILEWINLHRPFMLIVVLPTLLTALYYGLVASNQFETKAHFVVRSSQGGQAPTSGLGALLSLGGVSETKSDAMSVIDYLESTDAVLELDRRIALQTRFQHQDVDILSRLRDQPSPETLTKYYGKQVKIEFKEQTGITEMSVRAFEPKDSYLIASTLLQMGEERVNMLNRRSYQDTLSTATRQLKESENDMAELQREITNFRQVRSDVDPLGSGKLQSGLVTQLTAQLATARAQLQAMAGVISRSSPQYVATAAKVRAMEAQVAAQSNRLTGGNGNIASALGDYEALQVKQEFAAKRYDSAAAAFQAAREEARKKQLYLVRIVNPNMPVKSLFPERGRIILTVLASLLVAYAIGWLIIAGVKEHEM